MLYSLVRPLAKAAFYVYFRKIYLSHRERIPAGKPVILACNHPTGFMEPCIMACFLNRKLHFLVRGDFFVNPFYARLLRALHMLPVYRWKDGGYRNLRNNFSTFEACYEAFRRKQAIMIFVEGGTKYEKRLRPLQKGAARIAFGAMDQAALGEDLYIVPIGVTYTQADRFRSEVMIDCGEPISVQPVYERYRDNLPEGISELTRMVEQAMREHLVHVEHPSDDILVEYLLETDRSQRPSRLWPPLSRNNQWLERERRLAEWVNRLAEEEKATLRQQTYAYFDQLEQYRLSDQEVAGPPQPSWVSTLGLVLGFIPALVGFAGNFLPLWASKKLVEAKVAHIEFYGPVMVAAGIGFYLIYWLILLLIAGLNWGGAGLLAVLGISLLGLFSLAYVEEWYRWFSVWRVRRAKPAGLEMLREQRRRLMAGIEARVGAFS